MQLSDDAKPNGVRYATAWCRFRAGKIQSQRIGPQTTIGTQGQQKTPLRAPQPVATYARVASAEHNSALERQLERQAQRPVSYCTVRGDQVGKVVQEARSGVHAARPKVVAPLAEHTTGGHVVEQQDCLTRFRFRSLETLLLKEEARLYQEGRAFA